MLLKGGKTKVVSAKKNNMGGFLGGNSKMAPIQIKPNQGGLLQRGNAKMAPSQIKPNIRWFLQGGIFYNLALPPCRNHL